MSTTETRAYTVVTLPMRKRMRYLRDLGLGAQAIAVMIADEFDLEQPPSRNCVEAHAPRADGGPYGLQMAKGWAT